MEPREIVNSQDDGPYAIRTLLEWVVYGPVNRPRMQEAGITKTTANVISVTKLVNQKLEQYNNKLAEQRHEQKEGKKMKNDASLLSLKDDHQSLRPNQDADVMVTNGRQVTTKRTMNQRKLKMDEAIYQAEYTNFMEKVSPPELLKEMASSIKGLDADKMVNSEHSFSNGESFQKEGTKKRREGRMKRKLWRRKRRNRSFQKEDSHPVLDLINLTLHPSLPIEELTDGEHAVMSSRPSGRDVSQNEEFNEKLHVKLGLAHEMGQRKEGRLKKHKTPTNDLDTQDHLPEDQAGKKVWQP